MEHNVILTGYRKLIIKLRETYDDAGTVSNAFTVQPQLSKLFTNLVSACTCDKLS
jgi:hypothetical protein